MRRLSIALAPLSLLLLAGCSEMKLSNNKVPEHKAGQQGNDVTHQVTERHETYQAGAVGPAVSELNGPAQVTQKPNADAGAVTAMPNTANSPSSKPGETNTTNGVPQIKK